MIHKEPGNNKIHRLRVIHLFEADFNLILSVKWKQLLKRVLDAGFINPGQNGSCPGCESTGLPFLEELKMEISYLTRYALINMDVDASSCFDRIIPALASLINRKFGMHKNVVMVHAATLEKAKYKLKTALGVSEGWYQHSITLPIYGTGQGAGNSPVIWVARRPLWTTRLFSACAG